MLHRMILALRLYLFCMVHKYGGVITPGFPFVLGFACKDTKEATDKNHSWPGHGWVSQLQSDNVSKQAARAAAQEAYNT